MFHQSDMIVLENDKLVEVFTDTKPMSYLRPFFEKPLTLSEASQQLGLAMNSYHYWIKKFLDYGLLEVAYSQKRAGSTIKYYVTPARKILLKINKNTCLLEDLYNSYTEQHNLNYLTSQSISDTVYTHDLNLGILLKLDGDDDYWTVPVMLSNGEIINGVTNEMLKMQYPAAFSSSRTIFLNHEDAKELQRRLVSVLVEFDKRVDAKGERYKIELAMAPSQKNDEYDLD